MIMGADFCDKFEHAIRPGDKEVDLQYKPVIPILCNGLWM